MEMPERGIVQNPNGVSGAISVPPRCFATEFEREHSRVFHEDMSSRATRDWTLSCLTDVEALWVKLSESLKRRCAGSGRELSAHSNMIAAAPPPLTAPPSTVAPTVAAPESAKPIPNSHVPVYH